MTRTLFSRRLRRRWHVEILEGRALMTAGTLDTGFGGTGMVSTQIGSGTDDQGEAPQGRAGRLPRAVESGRCPAGQGWYCRAVRSGPGCPPRASPVRQDPGRSGSRPRADRLGGRPSRNPVSGLAAPGGTVSRRVGRHGRIGRC
jgi:hypothetical protein